MPQLDNLNHRHQAIINWLILNPDKPMKMCAAELGYSQTWLSIVINSDMFQTAYQAACQAAQEEAVHTITNKLKGTAYLALEKIEEKLQAAPSERFVIDSAKTTLQALGYVGKQEPAEQKHLHVHVSAEALMKARERAAARQQAPASDTSDTSQTVETSCQEMPADDEDAALAPVSPPVFDIAEALGLTA